MNCFSLSSCGLSGAAKSRRDCPCWPPRRDGQRAQPLRPNVGASAFARADDLDVVGVLDHLPVRVQRLDLKLVVAGEVEGWFVDKLLTLDLSVVVHGGGEPRPKIGARVFP